MPTQNLTVKVKRGGNKAFREYLNTLYPELKYRNWAYGNRTRWYGDYLFAQDRAMFDENIS